MKTRTTALILAAVATLTVGAMCVDWTFGTGEVENRKAKQGLIAPDEGPQAASEVLVD